MTLRIALLGDWHVHAHDYAGQVRRHPDAELVGVWEGPALAAELGVAELPSLERICDDGAIDGVIVSTATTVHPTVIAACAAAGKHIFTEKVLTLTLAEARPLAEAIRAGGGHFAISFPYRCAANTRYAHACLREGRLGRITSLRFHNSHDGGSAGWLPDGFFIAAECAGGAMLDLGCHGMYVTAWLLGLPETVQSTFTRVLGSEVDDNALSVLCYADGCIASNETAFVAHGPPHSLTISGTEGCLVIGGPQRTIAEKRRGGGWMDITELPPPAPSAIEQWLAAIVTDDPGRIECGLDEALQLTALMDAAYRSHGSGRAEAVERP